MKDYTFLPKTKLGKFSKMSAIGCILFLLGRVILASKTNYNSRFEDLLSIFFFFLEYLAGLAAIVTGVIAIVKKERSVLIFIYTAVAVGALLWFLFR